MKRLLLGLAVLTSSVCFAKDSCKANCAGMRANCKAACEDPKATKSRKSAAECVKQMCDLVVQQCEAQCGGANGKKH